jgi:hypothetical protein
VSALIASAYRNGHTLVAEHRSDLEMTAERFDLGTQRGEVHVAARLEAGHVSLGDPELLGELDLVTCRDWRSSPSASASSIARWRSATFASQSGSRSRAWTPRRARRTATRKASGDDDPSRSCSPRPSLAGFGETLHARKPARARRRIYAAAA